ncbi:MAG: alpha/beta hydrolase [Ignavibacteriaceae bacterium]
MKICITPIILFLLISTSLAQTNQFTIQTDTAYSFDNLPIVYQKAGNGKQALVFVHCWGCDKSYWEGQLKYFSDKYTVIAIDLAGHGESGTERKEYTIEDYGKDVKAVVEKENLTNIILIGHSMGGPVVLSAAEQLGNKVKALIAIDTFQDIEREFSKEDFDAFYKQFEDDFPATTKNYISTIFGDEADSNLVKSISEDIASEPKDIALASFIGLFNFKEADEFDKIDIPVRFLNSDKFPTNTESAKKHIKDFDLRIIKGTGHFPMLEKPDEFNRLLEEIINNLTD